MSGPSTRTKTRPTARIPTATTDGRMRTGKVRTPPIAASMMPSARRTSSTRSNVGTTAIAALAATPAPPWRTRLRRGIAAGANTKANTSPAATRTRSSAASGSTGRAQAKPAHTRRDEGGGQVRPNGRLAGVQTGGGGDRDGEQRHCRELHLDAITGEHSRARQSQQREHREAQGRAVARGDADGDPQGNKGAGDGEDDPRRGSGRHHPPTGRAAREPASRRNHASGADQQRRGWPRRLPDDCAEARG